MRSDRLLAAAALTFLTCLTFLTGSTLVLSGAQGTPAPVQTEAQLIEDLVASNRILHQQGINDAFGHVSVRSNQNPNHYYLARSLAPDLVTAADLIEYDLDSNPVNLNGRDQYSERYIHGEIYKTHPEIRAVVHNHSQDVIPFSISTVRLRPVFHVASFLGEGVNPERESLVSSSTRVSHGEALSSLDPKGILLGLGLAAKLGVKVGERVVLVATSASGGINAVEGHV